MTENTELNTDNLKSKILAGKAIITVKNCETDNRFTFKIKIADKDQENSPFFVSVLNGSDNYHNYKYIGLVDSRTTKFKATRTSNPESQSFKVFNWFMNNIESLPEKVKVYHSNKCLRCGRRLTTPESILTGMGSVCAEQIGL